jgi:hypothetical protein
VIAPKSADADITRLVAHQRHNQGRYVFLRQHEAAGRWSLLVSKKKKSLDYTTGTYFIHPDIMEEMRQKQRQQRQLVTEQGKEQQSTDPGKQATPIVLELPDATLTQTTQN